MHRAIRAHGREPRGESNPHSPAALGKNLQPFVLAFMALFERDRLPSRSALSRFLAALTEAPVEALRMLLTSRFTQPSSHYGLTGETNRRSGGSKKEDNH